jgi:hypothetical protein
MKTDFQQSENCDLSQVLLIFLGKIKIENWPLEWEHLDKSELVKNYSIGMVAEWGCKRGIGIQ